MAINFNGNKTMLVSLGSLTTGDTFMYEGRIGLITELYLWDDDFNTKEPQRFFIDLTNGRDFYTNSGDTLDSSEWVTPIEINAEIV